jgi:hypothetical protein
VSNFRRTAIAAAVSASLAGAIVLAQAGSVFAYGHHQAQYQVEISANFQVPGGGAGYGFWLWIELDSNHQGDYTGSDCGHNVDGLGVAGAVADMGDVNWTSDGSTITITGVVLKGVPPSGLPLTISLPDAYGHSTTTIEALTGIPMPGWAQVQVAP